MQTYIRSQKHTHTSTLTQKDTFTRTLIFSTTFLVRLDTYSCIAAGGLGTYCRMFSTRFTNGDPGGEPSELPIGKEPGTPAPALLDARAPTSASASSSPYNALSRNSLACIGTWELQQSVTPTILKVHLVHESTEPYSQQNSSHSSDDILLHLHGRAAPRPGRCSSTWEVRR